MNRRKGSNMLAAMALQSKESSEHEFGCTQATEHRVCFGLPCGILGLREHCRSELRAADRRWHLWPHPWWPERFPARIARSGTGILYEDTETSRTVVLSTGCREDVARSVPRAILPARPNSNRETRRTAALSDGSVSGQL
jgi:hypothetical protein